MSKQAQLQAEFDLRKSGIENRYETLKKKATEAHQLVMDAISDQMDKELSALEVEYWTPKPKVEEVAIIASPPGMPVE